MYSLRKVPRGVATLLAAFSVGCSANSQTQNAASSRDAATSKPVACTMMFAMIGVRVTDSALRPVSDVDVTVTRKRTGEKRTLTQSSAPERGFYTIADDSMREDLTAAGEVFEVVARSGAKRATANLTIGLTEGRCHVTKLAGPETLVLQ